MPLELMLTVIPFLIISVLFYYTVVVQEKIMNIDPNPEVVVDVTAFQWNWKFGYQSINFADGTYSYEGADEERSRPCCPSRTATVRTGTRPAVRSPA